MADLFCFSIGRKKKMFHVDENGIGHDVMEVRSTDTDRFFKAKIPFFFTVLQEAAAKHSTLLHCGIPELVARENKTWVIVRAKMIIDKLPDWMDNVNIETWAEDPFKLFAPRLVTGKDDNGGTIFTTISHWVILDLERKRPIRPNEALKYFRLPDKETRYIDPDIGKLRIAEDFKGFRLPDFIPRTNYYDTDTNGHINNVSYINWLCDAFPFSFLDSHRLHMIDCHWEKQTFDGDEVAVETYSESQNPLTDDSPVFFTRIVKKEEDGTLTSVFEAETEWVKKELN